MTLADMTWYPTLVFMEYMLIAHWRYAVWRLSTGASTVGCELFCHRHRNFLVRDGDPSFDVLGYWAGATTAGAFHTHLTSYYGCAQDTEEHDNNYGHCE